MDVLAATKSATAQPKMQQILISPAPKKGFSIASSPAMHNSMLLINILLAILIVIFILVQGRGGGLGSAWGGGGETFHTRRGIERVTIRVTVILIAAFFVLSAINLFIK